MSVRIGGWSVLAGVVAVSGIATVLAQAPPRFRTGVDIVVVEATVVDRDGAVAAGLGPADFAVEIDGKPREIVAADLVRHESADAESSTSVSPEITSNQQAVAGRRIVIVIDHVSLRVESQDMIEAASRWVGTLSAGDRVGVMVLPLPGVNIEFTTDHARVREALATVRPLAKPPMPFSYRTVSPYEAIRITEGDTFITQHVLARECRGEPACPDEIKFLARSMKLDSEAAVMPFLGSLRAVVKAMGALPGPKHAVLLSSGWLMTERDAATAISTVAADASVSNVTVHTFTSEDLVPTASQRRPSPTPGQDRALLVSTVEMMSGMTGGRAVRMASKGDLAFASLSAGLGGYYRLGVRALPEDLDGKPRRISVKVLRAGAKLAGNRRILAATVSPTAKALASGDAQTALRAALESPTPVLDVDLRATSYVLHGEAGSRDVHIVVVGDVGRAAAGKATAVAALYDLEGRPANAMENVVDVPASGSAPVSIDVPAPPGLYVLRLAVRDAEGHVGSLERPIDARWKTIAGVETPGLVLFRSALGASTPSGLLFGPVTTREQVIAQVALSGPFPDATTQIVFEVTKPGSATPAARRTARIAQTTGGTTVARDALPAVTLPPGRYTWSVKIGSGPALLTRDFTVAAAP